MLNCKCYDIEESENEEPLSAFSRVRDACPALNKVFIPDDIWNEYQNFCAEPSDEALHAPITYLAYKRKHLARLTGPVHQLLFNENELNPRLAKPYKSDLVERWMFQNDIDQRFKKASIFQGKLYELVFAHFLTRKRWRVESLEALGGSADVKATSPDGHLFSFEVKHIGTDNVLFELGVKALSEDGVSCGYTPVYSPVDYLIYRVYEAAKQLDGSKDQKVIVIVLDEYQTYFERPLKEGWIDWRNPKFLRQDQDIDPFLDEKYAKNPNLDDDVKKHISKVHQIWFYSASEPLVIRRQQVEILND